MFWSIVFVSVNIDWYQMKKSGDKKELHWHKFKIEQIVKGLVKLFKLEQLLTHFVCFVSGIVSGEQEKKFCAINALRNMKKECIDASHGVNAENMFVL